jgi:hypothetical protein
MLREAGDNPVIWFRYWKGFTVTICFNGQTAAPCRNVRNEPGHAPDLLSIAVETKPNG